MARALSPWMVVVLVLVSSPARAQEPPPLEPPADEAAPNPSPPPKPAAAKPVVVKPPVEAAALRPLLVIPGVNAPPQTTTPSTPPSDRPTRPTGPPLTGPTDPPADRKGVVQSRVEPRVVVKPPIPITLEPIEDVPADEARESRPPAAKGARAANPPSSSSPPARPQGFFARLFKIAPPPLERRAPATREVEPPRVANSDPRRVLEREIHKALGDRARSVEVRVSGKNALVVVRPTRFWQKRAIRTIVESLPALAAYHARIDILD